MNLWLMIASYVFYGWWNPWYLLLLFGTSAIDYVMVLFMERSQRNRKLWLIISLVSNFGFLGYFKYSGFLTENLNSFLAFLGLGYSLPDPVAYANALLNLTGIPTLLSFFGSPVQDEIFTRVILPIGISFHTFQSMSYTIDAYRGVIKTERSFVRFLTFVSFFPQLVAGPIERASNLLPQLQKTPIITRGDLADGLSLFLVGFFKKVALADYLGRYVDPIYRNPAMADAPALLLATAAFAWQIYFDFSGYTDMARGIARAMGFRLMLNFNNPYTATGLGDFWARWHISLSTWFKDYLYFPLGGNRRGKVRTYGNMIVTMVISGIWHGAAWTFVVWGLLHALGRCLTRELEQTPFYKQRVPTFLKQIAVLSFVTVTWIFFSAVTLDQAWLILSRIFTAAWTDPHMPLLMMGLVGAVWIYQLLFASDWWRSRVLELAPVRLGLVVFMVVYLAVVAQPSTKAFIYFQF
jgi:D-alanyl-lipoteichoic acid acyltransferase DltB (MBOAT superfamily)